MAGDYALKELLELMKLLSSETRLRILEILAEEPVYLPPIQRKVDARVGHHAGESLNDPLHADGLGGHRLCVHL